jgi:catechol 2,3-dioxygenase-like lactoylglutathione lyase family enzyme
VNFQGVVLNVSNLERSIDFYRDVFGFDLLSQRDQLAALGAPSSERSQVIVLRVLGSGRSGGAHVGIRAFVLEVTSADLEQIEQALNGRNSLNGRITDNASWKGVIGQDPDRVAVAAVSPLGPGQIDQESWTVLHDSLYGIGE